MTIDEIIDQLNSMDSAIEQKQWYLHNRKSILSLLAEFARDEFKSVLTRIRGVLKNTIKGFVFDDANIYYQKEKLREQKERSKDHFDDEVQFNTTEKGDVLHNIPNTVTILTKAKHLYLCHDELKDHSYYEIYGEREAPWENDTRKGWIEIKYPVTHRIKGVDVARYYDVYNDYQYASLKQYLSNFFPNETRWTALKDAITVSAMTNRVNIQQDYYENGLPDWDGVDRYDYFYKYFGETDKKWAYIAGKHLMLSIMARAFKPGFDYRGIIALVGPENIGKTRFCKALAFHEDTYTSLFLSGRHDGEYEVARQIEGKTIIELTEGGNLNRKNNEFVKQLLTATGDSNRRMHSNTVDHNLRHGVMISTSNHLDLSGQDTNTRYLVIRCGKVINIDEFEKILPLLLAQALRDWQSGIVPRLTDEEWSYQQQHVREYEVKGDLYIPVIELMLSRINEILQEGVHVRVYTELLRNDLDLRKTKHQVSIEIGDVLNKLGFTDDVFKSDGKSIRRWRYKGNTALAEFLRDKLDE